MDEEKKKKKKKKKEKVADIKRIQKLPEQTLRTHNNSEMPYGSDYHRKFLSKKGNTVLADESYEFACCMSFFRRHSVSEPLIQ